MFLWALRRLESVLSLLMHAISLPCSMDDVREQLALMGLPDNLGDRESYDTLFYALFRDPDTASLLVVSTCAGALACLAFALSQASLQRHMAQRWVYQSDTGSDTLTSIAKIDLDLNLLCF